MSILLTIQLSVVCTFLNSRVSVVSFNLVMSYVPLFELEIGDPLVDHR